MPVAFSGRHETEGLLAQLVRRGIFLTIRSALFEGVPSMSIPRPLLASERSEGNGAEYRAPNVVLRRGEVMRRVGLKASAFDELRKRDEFPKSTTITGRTPVWLEREIDQWIERRFAKRDHGAAS
jgi:predicted DNA-binding transcriptional regulator AlpA